MDFIIVIGALALDRLLGEPKSFHPLVGFGYLAERLEARFNQRKRRKWFNFACGLIGLVVLILPALILTLYFQSQLENHTVWLLLFNITIVYLAIGHQSLQEHVLDVKSALQADELEHAREKLSYIVSRETQQLNPQQVTQATIETSLENGNDATFAVIFWFCLFGAPAVVVYRIANTLDAMWGYRTTRYEYFGKVAARLDDIMNYVPARLVALTYAVLGNTRQALRCWKNQAKQLNSPNAGPVMTAGAGSLGVVLGGSAYYHGELVYKPVFGNGKAPDLGDIKRTLTLMNRSVIVWCVVILCLDILGLDILGLDILSLDIF